MEASARIALLEEQLRRCRERIDQLEHMLGLAIEPSVALGLTASEARVFGLLMARDAVTKPQIMSALYDMRPDGDVAEQRIVDVFVCKIRRKLERYGVKISTIWGQGYSLAPEDKARARQLLAAPQR